MEQDDRIKRFMPRAGAILIILLSLQVSNVLSIDFKRITVEDGLSNSIVFSISQTSNGLIWFCTKLGIDSYDGSQFTHFDLRADSTSLPAQGRHILLDSNDNLWVGSTNGVFRYDPKRNHFKIASQKFLKHQHFKVFKLRADCRGRLWIGASNSLYLFDPFLDSLRQIQEITIPVNDILCASDDFTLVATIRGVYKINNSDLSVSSISSEKQINDLFSDEFVSALSAKPDGNVWIAVLNKGLFVYDPIRETITHVHSIQKYIEPGIHIRDIEYRNNSEYLIATDNNGLLLLDPDYSVKEHIVHIEDDNRSLSSNGIRELFTDFENRLWISIYGGGACLFDPYLLPFNRIEHIMNSTHSVSNNYGRAVLEDPYGRLWFGTDKGISIYDPDVDQWKHVCNTRDNPSLLGYNIIKTLCQVSPEEIWIGSYGGGIDRINIDNLEVTPLFPRDKVESVLGSSYIYVLHKGLEGYIWISLLRSQMVRLDPETHELVRYPIKDIQHFYENDRGELLISSKHGLFILHKSTSEISQYYHRPADPYSLSSSEVYASLFTGDGETYIGTCAGGLNKFDPESQRFIHFNRDHGLPSNSVYGMAEDHRGMIWLSTSSGISMFNPSDESFVNFDVSDGLHMKEFNAGTSALLEDGRIIFGGTRGFVSFFPDQIRKITIPPRLIFTDLKVSNLSVEIDPEKGPLRQAIDLTEDLTFKHNQNSFAVSFIGINFTNPDKNLYSWKLEGYEDSWSPATNKNSATYKKIPPGSYTFKVRSTNLQDGWNGNERSIAIQITPIFFRTFWAYLIYFTILVIIVFMVFKFLRTRYEEHHAKEKIQFFVNLAHDLRAPLTLIKSPLSKLLEDNAISENDRKYLTLSQRNADRLHQIFNQLLDFQKADLRKMQLLIGEYDLVAYLGNIIESFQPLLEKKQIRYTLQADNEKMLVWFDMEKMDKVFYNIFSNAIKYTQEKGNIEVNIFATKNHCHVEVKDNGIGIPSDQQKFLFKRYFRATNAINSAETGSGVGLILVKLLVELHKGSVGLVSQSGEGTSIRIRIPLGNKHFRKTDFLAASGTRSRDGSISGMIHDTKIPSEFGTGADTTTEERSRKARIVVAEDNDELRDFLVDSLSPGYRVFGSPNGWEALSLISKVHPNIVISDVMMPEMDGITLCIQLKRQFETSHIPVILLTALTDNDYKIEGFESGADAYLDKPFDMNVLRSRIENLLESRELLKNKFLKYTDREAKFDFKSKIDQDFIQKAVQIVHDHLDDSDFSVEKFCKLLYISRSALYRKLTALLDQTPQDFIKVIRLKKAVEYLQQSGLNVSEIAYRTGFSDPKYFTTCFKKHFGLSPTRFVRQLNGHEGTV